jgi:hypothetical protein
MKARIKATGEIIEVSVIGTLNGNRYRRTDGQNELYESKDLDLNLETIINPDYWTRLEHTYAGMAMQGILSNQDYVHTLVQRVASREIHNLAEGITKHAEQLAHALVEKMKEERK